jgi:hypothetical protein
MTAEELLEQNSQELMYCKYLNKDTRLKFGYFNASVIGIHSSILEEPYVALQA